MTKPSLSRLYRRLTTRPAGPVVDGPDLCKILSGDGDAISTDRRDAMLAAVAASAPQAALMRMLAALNPLSEDLAAAVAQQHHGAHVRRARGSRRTAAGARRGQVRGLRWASGIAACACAIVVLGIWSLHRGQSNQEGARVVHMTPMPDRIFTSRDVIFATSVDGLHRAKTGAPSDDELFQGSFSTGG